MSNNPPEIHHPDGILFIVSGPSGAGKTTLIERVRNDLAEKLDIRLHFSVSHTTRTPREGEIDGKHYHFVSRSTFEAMVERGEFLEWAHVHDQMYGTSNAEVLSRLKQGQDVILDIDVQGARQIANNPLLEPHSLSVFIFPPTFHELERRLRARGLNSEEQIDRRLQKALSEIEEGYSGSQRERSIYDYIVINDDADVATENLKAAIIARKLKSKSVLDSLQEMARSFKEERSGRFASGR